VSHLQVCSQIDAGGVNYGAGLADSSSDGQPERAFSCRICKSTFNMTLLACQMRRAEVGIAGTFIEGRVDVSHLQLRSRNGNGEMIVVSSLQVCSQIGIGSMNYRAGLANPSSDGQLERAFSCRICKSVLIMVRKGGDCCVETASLLSPWHGTALLASHAETGIAKTARKRPMGAEPVGLSHMQHAHMQHAQCVCAPTD